MKNDSLAILLCLAFTVGFLVLPLALSAAPRHQITQRQVARIAYQKCGPEGTVDWDDNRRFPPPHCNRNGWNGKRYVERRSQ